MFPLPPLTITQRAIGERGARIASVTSEPEQSNDRGLETAGKRLCGRRAATLEFQ